MAFEKDNGFRSLYEGGEGGAASGEGGGGGAGGPLGGAKDGGGGAGGGLPTGAVYSDHRFIESLPEDIRGNENLVKHSKGGLEALARAHIHATRLIGKDPQRLLEIPDKIDDKTIATVAGRMGNPTDFKDYKVMGADGKPIELSPMGQKAAAKAHATGVLPSQFSAIYGEFAGDLKAAVDKQAKDKADKATSNIAGLRTELGGAFDERIAVANRAIDKAPGGDKVRAALQAAGLDSDPDVLKFLMHYGAMAGEDSAEGGAEGGAGGFGNKLTPAEARTQGEALLRQAMNEKNLVEKRRLNREAQKYFAMIPAPKG